MTKPREFLLQTDADIEEIVRMHAAPKGVVPLAPMYLDSELRMYADLVDELDAGRKRCTIRYRKDHIRLPTSTSLPVIETRPDDASYRRLAGTVQVTGVTFARACEFSDVHAWFDGFASWQDMMEGMSAIYGTVQPGEYLSLYVLDRFTPVKD